MLKKEEEKEEVKPTRPVRPVVEPPSPDEEEPDTKYYKADFSFRAFRGKKVNDRSGFNDVETLAEMAEFIKNNVPSAVGFYTPVKFEDNPDKYRKYTRAITWYRRTS